MKNKILIHDISQLYPVATAGESCKTGIEMADACRSEDAYILIEEGKIKGVGDMRNLSTINIEGYDKINGQGRIVFPGFVDSHTHIIFAQTREEEYLYKIQGLSYEEIARRGGGILNSAQRLAETSEESLLESALVRALSMLEKGTTTLEIKSGYGLSLAGELKMLRVAKRLKAHTPQTIRTTFLGAHALPLAYKDKRQEYIRLVCEEMIPAIVEEQLADFIDVFCETGYFTESETEQILTAGQAYGLAAKIHANQLDYSDGVRVGVKMGAVSVDHLERCSNIDIARLQASNTVPTLLPACSFFLRDPYAPARKLIEAGLPVCLATDYNPGSAPSGSMPFVLSLACTYMRMTPEEALCASTLNGAKALRLSHSKGSIEIGKDADLVMTQPLRSLAAIPYHFTDNLIDTVICGGKHIRVGEGGVA